MKAKILPVIILLLLFGGVVFAQETELPAVSQIELPDPGLTPDSPFYFLETIAEGIGTFFTFGDLKKAERHTVLAAERLAEAKVMAEKESFDKAQDKKLKLIEKTLERYENQLVKALLRTKKAETKGKNTEEVVKTIDEATQKHLIVLEEVLEKVPEEAKPAIRRAMIVSTKEGLEMAAAEAESGQGFSFRALCIEQGGPPEQCEKLPQAIESFEALEAFCVEQGGSPEQCAETEAMCKEMGAMTPDECSRGFFTITTGAPSPLFEEQAEEWRLQEDAREEARREQKKIQEQERIWKEQPPLFEEQLMEEFRLQEEAREAAAREQKKIQEQERIWKEQQESGN